MMTVVTALIAFIGIRIGRRFYPSRALVSVCLLLVVVVMLLPRVMEPLFVTLPYTMVYIILSVLKIILSAALGVLIGVLLQSLKKS